MVATDTRETAPPPGLRWSDVAELAGLAGVIGAVLYGYGWLVAARFYGHFDVSPEEVGIGFGLLTVRVAVAVASVGALVLLITYLLARTDDPRSPAVVAGTLVAMITAGVVVAVLLFNLFTEPGDDAVWLARIVAGGLGVAAGWATGRALQWLKVKPLRERRLHWQLLVLSVIAVILFSPLVFVPDHLARRVQEDVEPVRIRVGPLVSLVDVELVSVTWVDSPAQPPALSTDDCVFLLGSAGGVTVFYGPDSETTVRLPSDRLNIVAPCSS